MQMAECQFPTHRRKLCFLSTGLRQKVLHLLTDQGQWWVLVKHQGLQSCSLQSNWAKLQTFPSTVCVFVSGDYILFPSPFTYLSWYQVAALQVWYRRSLHDISYSSNETGIFTHLFIFGLSIGSWLAYWFKNTIVFLSWMRSRSCSVHFSTGVPDLFQ